MLIKNRFRFGDFKLPNNFIILGVVSIVAIVIIVVIMMNINNHVIPVTTPAPTTTTPAPTVSPFNTNANRQLLNNINKHLKDYIVDQRGELEIHYDLSDIMPRIDFTSDSNYNYYLDIDYGDGKGIQRFVETMGLKAFYRFAVDAINKFNADRRTGLSIPSLIFN